MFSKPQANLAELGLTPGALIADFGAGTGEYALEAAALVGVAGRVYAVEVQQGLVERLAAEAKTRRLENVKTIWGNVEQPGGSKLADGAVNWVLIANLLFQADARYAVALEAKRVLRPGGWVAVIDWNDSFGGLGPHPERVVTSAEAKKIFAEAGFQLEREFPAGEHHYGLIFLKPK